MYLTKEDDRPYLFGIRVSECSLYCRCWHHAKTEYRVPRPINKADPFILSLGQNSRFAVSVIEKHLEELRKQVASQRNTYQPNMNCSVTREILNVLTNSNDHLYITGAPGLGKTEVVDYFLKVNNKDYWKAGEPSSFLFGTLRDDHDFIWFEDYDMFKYSGHLNTLLSLMDHKQTTISKKCADDRTIVSPARHIYISNYDIPNDYPMFRRRVNVINVNHRLWECNGCFDYLNDPAIMALGAGVDASIEALGEDTIQELINSF